MASATCAVHQSFAWLSIIMIGLNKHGCEHDLIGQSLLGDCRFMQTIQGLENNRTLRLSERALSAPTNEFAMLTLGQ